jgi:hypothetical protein
MLSELQDIQASADETTIATEVSISIETRVTSSEDIIERTYVFSYAKEWDKWTLVEFVEQVADDTLWQSDRDWDISEHTYWYDEEADIQVPKEVADTLAKATGGDVTIQAPVCDENNEYVEIYES